MITFKEHFVSSSTPESVKVKNIKPPITTEEYDNRIKEYPCNINGFKCRVLFITNKEGKELVEVYHESSGTRGRRFWRYDQSLDKIERAIKEWEFNQKLPTYAGLMDTFGSIGESVVVGDTTIERYATDEEINSIKKWLYKDRGWKNKIDFSKGWLGRELSPLTINRVTKEFYALPMINSDEYLICFTSKTKGLEFLGKKDYYGFPADKSIRPNLYKAIAKFEQRQAVKNPLYHNPAFEESVDNDWKHTKLVKIVGISYIDSRTGSPTSDTENSIPIYSIKDSKNGTWKFRTDRSTLKYMVRDNNEWNTIEDVDRAFIYSTPTWCSRMVGAYKRTSERYDFKKKIAKQAFKMIKLMNNTGGMNSKYINPGLMEVF